MTIPILICDDSRMARNQLARSLPTEFSEQLQFAENGREALTKIRSSKPQLVFLDLNMPEMDGYQTLKALQELGLDTPVIVVSGDIQPQAKTRVEALGAIDFIRKPATKQGLHETLASHGFISGSSEVDTQSPEEDSQVIVPQDLDDPKVFLDACQEIANVAMGRAGDSLARFLDTFIQLPIPKVNHIELAELAMALEYSHANETVSSVCQGFIGPGLAGEALVIFNDSSFAAIAELMRYDGKIDDQVQLELLMDIANILVGACLQGISEQLDINLSQGHPAVMGQHVKMPKLLSRTDTWQRTLSIEILFGIEKKGVDCDLLILFSEDSIDTLKQKFRYIL